MKQWGESMSVYQIAPFNRNRLEQCVLWFLHQHKRPLSQYEVVKLHFLTDFFHVLKEGVPVIGGVAEAWKKGPVVRNTYDFIMAVAKRKQPSDCLAGKPNQNLNGAYYQFHSKPNCRFDLEDFSASEIEAMERAWGALNTRHRNPQGEDFFHDASTFVGAAWHEAYDKRGKNAPIDWRVLITKYDEFNHTDHADVLGILSISDR